MSRTTQTECAYCGKEIEVDYGADDGADEWSIQQREDFCSWTCEEAAFR